MLHRSKSYPEHLNKSSHNKSSHDKSYQELQKTCDSLQRGLKLTEQLYLRQKNMNNNLRMHMEGDRNVLHFFSCEFLRVTKLLANCTCQNHKTNQKTEQNEVTFGHQVL